MSTESSTESTMVIRCEAVSRTYLQGGVGVDVLTNLDCKIERGELVAIVGSSGSGKSTLLNIMGGLDDPSSGEVFIAGQQVRPLSESKRAALRNRHLGFVYQFHHLLGEFTAVENVAIPNMIGGMRKKEALEIAADLLDKVGLGKRFGHKPSALSGGERQRVAIARSLATSPSCVLMDEPTGNLDPATAASVFALLLELNRSLRISFVVVTHDMAIARQMSRVLKLDNGRLVTLEEANG